MFGGWAAQIKLRATEQSEITLCKEAVIGKLWEKVLHGGVFVASNSLNILMNCFKDIITASLIDLIIVKSTPFKRKSIFTPIRMKCSESEQGLPPSPPARHLPLSETWHHLCPPFIAETEPSLSFSPLSLYYACMERLVIVGNPFYTPSLIQVHYAQQTPCMKRLENFLNILNDPSHQDAYLQYIL